MVRVADIDLPCKIFDCLFLRIGQLDLILDIDLFDRLRLCRCLYHHLVELRFFLARQD